MFETSNACQTVIFWLTRCENQRFRPLLGIVTLRFCNAYFRTLRKKFAKNFVVMTNDDFCHSAVILAIFHDFGQKSSLRISANQPQTPCFSPATAIFFTRKKFYIQSVTILVTHYRGNFLILGVKSSITYGKSHVHFAPCDSQAPSSSGGQPLLTPPLEKKFPWVLWTKTSLAYSLSPTELKELGAKNKKWFLGRVFEN